MSKYVKFSCSEDRLVFNPPWDLDEKFIIGKCVRTLREFHVVIEETFGSYRKAPYMERNLSVIDQVYDELVKQSQRLEYINDTH